MCAGSAPANAIHRSSSAAVDSSEHAQERCRTIDLGAKSLEVVDPGVAPLPREEENHSEKSAEDGSENNYRFGAHGL